MAEGWFLFPEAFLTGKGFQNWLYFYISSTIRVSDVTLEQFLGAISCRRPCFIAMVSWCGGGLFSASDSVQREKVGKIGKRLLFNRVSEGTLESFLVRFRGLSVLHCHSVLVSGFSVLHCHGVLVCFQHRIQYNGKRLGKLAKGYFLTGFQKGR